MRLMKETDQVAQVFDSWRIFKWFLALLSLVSSWFTVSFVVFLRKEFGERYLSWINLFFGYTVVANIAFLGGLVGMASGRGFPLLMMLFWLAFIAASFDHRWKIARKNKACVEWHSMSHGTSLLPLP